MFLTGVERSRTYTGEEKGGLFLCNPISYDWIYLIDLNLQIIMNFIQKYKAALKLSRWPMVDYVKQAEQEQQEKVNRLYPKK